MTFSVGCLTGLPSTAGRSDVLAPFVSLHGKVRRVHTSSVRLYTQFPQFDPTAARSTLQMVKPQTTRASPFFSSLSLLNFIFCQRISCPSVLCLALSSTSSSAGDDNQPPSASASQDSVWNWPVRKDQLPEMSKGLVLLHSLGIGRESGGVSFGPYWPLFSSLRPQDVFSKGLVHLPRKGRLRFPCTESRISKLLFFFFLFLSNYTVCLYKYITLPKNAHISSRAPCFPFLYDIWSLLANSEYVRGGSLSWMHRERLEEVGFPPLFIHG